MLYPKNFNRYDLHAIYREVIADPDVSAQWDTRVLKTIDKEFYIEDIEGNIRKDIMALFEAEWFHTWIRKTLDSYLWGFSLIEFGPWSERGFEPYIDTQGYYHDAVEVVDRDYVKPEFAKIVQHYGDDMDGPSINYLSDRLAERLMFIGSPNLQETILYKIAGYGLLKDNAHKNWSEWAEVFASDFRIGKTEASGEERQKFINAMRDMGSNGYAVIDVDDMIEYVGVNRQDAYKVYEAFLDYCDAKISEKIFGQSVVTNNTGRVVGKVGEEISNLYGDSDAKFIQWTINTKLLPFMSKMGAEVDGVRFRYDTTEKIKLTERAKVDKAIADMGYRISTDYLEKTYSIKLEEYIGVPYTGVKQEEE